MVDIQLEKYFNTVNQDKLMSLITRELKDKRVLKLIGAYLYSRVMINVVIVETDQTKAVCKEVPP
jgi:retron-type reverse transcriptase